MSEAVVKQTVVVTDPAGIHARTAVAIAEAVRGGKSEVTLIKDNQRVAATDVLQILTMVVHQGECLEVEAVGADAAAVLEALEPLFAGEFGDEARQPE